jgi:phospholipid/cholesterol/gamma-HCH transport system substrate-binding protein
MDARVNYTAVGVFVIVLGIALVAVSAWLTSAADTKVYNYYRVYTRESVAGLNLNASVKYKGVDVGQVINIELDRYNPDRVELLLEIEQGAPIRENTIAKLVSRGVTGLVYVELSGGGQSPPLTPNPEGPFPIIKSGPSLVSRVEDAFNNLSIKLDYLLREENLIAFSQILANIETITTLVATRFDDITQIVVALETIASTLAGNVDNINNTLDNASNTLAHSARISGELESLLVQTKTTLIEAAPMIKAITKTIEEVEKAVTDSRREIRRLAQQTAPELNMLLTHLQRLSETMERFIRTLDRNPRMLLLGRPKGALGPGE